MDLLASLLSLVPSSLHERSGSVFYSGRSAFAQPSDLYILGLNPGGSPIAQSGETIGKDIEASLSGRQDWSAYQDDSWQGRCPGTWRMQPRVLHLLRGLGRDPRRTPASNVVLVRTAREADLRKDKAALLAACWPVHAAVIEALEVKAIVCFGRTAGGWVREALGAHEPAGRFVEGNQRQWTSTAHRNVEGRIVLTLTHPSIADWRCPATDPTALVREGLEAAPL